MASAQVSPPTVAFDLEPRAGASASGSVILAANGAETVVDLGMRGLVAGNEYSVTLHAGTC